VKSCGSLNKRGIKYCDLSKQILSEKPLLLASKSGLTRQVLSENPILLASKSGFSNQILLEKPPISDRSFQTNGF
jgi:hypothetical protein